MSGGPSTTKDEAVIKTLSVTSFIPLSILPGPITSQHLYTN